MPTFNYLKVVDEDNITFIIKKKGLFGNHEKAFENIQRQLVDRFGLSESFIEIIELQKEIIALKCEVAISGDKFNNTFIRIHEEDLKQKLEQKSLKSNELKILIEKWIGFKLNLHELSVSEWFSYLHQYSEFNKQNNKE
jgi:hypothetical protein